MRPSEWRTRKAEVIEFRQARAELSKAVPDVAAEIVNLEQRRREADRPKTERTGPRISGRFDIKAQNEARERERREQEAEQEREQRDPAYRREKADRKLVEWNDEVMREKAKIVKQIRADTLEKARLHVEKWQAHIDSKPLLFFGEKARIWQKKDDEMDEQDSLNRRKLDEINEKGWPMNNDERAVVQQAAEQVAAKKPELARQAQAAHNLIHEENWRERERQAQEQARTALEREFKGLAANRAMKANGYTDDSKKWQATPKPLREIIDLYNSHPKDSQGGVLAAWMRDPEKSRAIEAMIEERKENTQGYGMSR
jgi:hypothetical protein